MKQKIITALLRQGAIFLLSSAVLGCGSSGSKPNASSLPASSVSSTASGTVISSQTSSSASSGAGPALILAVNVGAYAAASYKGIEYEKDRLSTGGAPNSTNSALTGDPEGSLFKTERYGSYSYQIPVTQGSYDVELHFVEMFQTSVGKRSFSVLVEDKTLFNALDLFATAGHNNAYSRTLHDVKVTDGFLTIKLESLIDNGTLSGFAIYSRDGAFIPPIEAEPGPVTPGEPGIASAENKGADCPVPTLADASKLPSNTKLPDPFTTAAGARITTKDQWRCLRQETNLALQHYETGTKPPKPATVAGSVTTQAITVNVEHQGKQISFSATVTLPTAGTAPYPAIIGVGGSNLNNAYLASQGIAVINFNNNQMGAQAGGNSRGTGLFFDLYGRDASASSITAWTWGISRLIDVIDADKNLLIDATRLGVTGCSRNGKGALLAGAMDERIALTIPRESGAGGAVSWRVAQVLSDSGIETQTLGSAAGEQPWFRASFGQTFGGPVNVTHLPFDHHQLLGMVAPRGLLVLDNDIGWLGPLPAFIATSAAKEIYRALGVPQNIAYSENGNHGHCQFPEHQLDVLSAFVQRFLLGKQGNTEVMRSTKGMANDVEKWIDWTTPILQ